MRFDRIAEVRFQTSHHQQFIIIDIMKFFSGLEHKLHCSLRIQINYFAIMLYGRISIWFEFIVNIVYFSNMYSCKQVLSNNYLVTLTQDFQNSNQNVLASKVFYSVYKCFEFNVNCINDILIYVFFVVDDLQSILTNDILYLQIN